MERFAELLDRLVLAPQRNAKLRLIADYLTITPDPDRGYAIAAMSGDLSLATVKAAMLRAVAETRIDPQLFAISYDYVGDLAETIALAWPRRPGANAPPSIAEVIDRLASAPRADAPKIIANWFDAMDAPGRFALIKLATGALRVGVSARLAKTALAEWSGRDVAEIEEVWHGQAPPYEALFAWLERRGPRPAEDPAPFRPVMLAHPLDEQDLAILTPDAYAAEWKWDGVRVQAVSVGGVRRLYTRTGEEIGAAFPDIIAAMDFEAGIDGELLVFDPDKDGLNPLPFGELQKRLNRKSADAKLLAALPAFVRAYDLLSERTEDLRPLSFDARRARLEAFMQRQNGARFDLSPLVPFADARDLAEARQTPPHAAIEGLMLKRRAAPYVAGRPRGEWWKWKRDPYTVDAVLMYAQRGHGKRSSFYSDFTFGVWRGVELVPVGKAYFGFTDDELKDIDRFVRNNTIERFGPVRSVTATASAGLVFEVAFEGLNRSTRHKSGVAMRFPRISRIRWDKPPGEADRIELLLALIDDGPGAA